MFAVLLITLAVLIQAVLAKSDRFDLSHRREIVAANGFLNAIWMTLGFASLLVIGLPWHLRLAAIPVVFGQAVLAISLVYVQIRAERVAETATFELATLTMAIPLVAADLVLGHHLGLWQLVAGSGLLVTGVYLWRQGLRRRGAVAALSASLLLALQLVGLRYNVDHGTSVVANQLLVGLITSLFFYVMCYLKLAIDPLSLLKRWRYDIGAIALASRDGLLAFAFANAPLALVMLTWRSLVLCTRLIRGKIWPNASRWWLNLIIGLALVGLVVVILS